MGESPVSAQMGLADCYSRLGDLALENDGDAMSDYTSCLNTLKSINVQKAHCSEFQFALTRAWFSGE